MKKNQKIILMGMCLIAVVTAATHWPALSAKAYMFDDDQYLINNRLVKNPSWASTRTFLTEVLAPSTVRGYYQPLTMISLMFDVKAGGSDQNLTLFRQTSLAIHVANTLLIVVLLYLLFGSPIAALMAGLLYGLSPTTIESIAWLSERKTLLACFFGLLSLISYLLYTKKNRRLFYFSSLLMYVLALMSKPSIIAIPALLLLVDYWPLNRLSKRALLEKIPFFAVGLIWAVITYISQSGTSGVSLPAQTGTFNILLTICHNIVFYLQNMFWPTNLSWYYPYPRPFDLSNPKLIVGLVGTVVLLAGLLISLRWTKSLITGWLFFFLAILPTLGIVGFHPVIAADRHMYFPMIGLLLPVTLLLAKLMKSSKPYIHIIVISAVIILSVFQFRLTRSYLYYWQNSERLYKYMLKFSPDVAILHNNLANFLKEKDQPIQAIEHYKRSLELQAGSAAVYNNLGNAYRQIGNYDQAIESYKNAIKLNPDLSQGHFNLACVLADDIKTPQAITQAIVEYKKAIELERYDADARIKLGLLLASQGDFELAIKYYNMALEIDPDNILAHGNLALALASQNRLEQALRHCRFVIAHSPGDLEMRFNIGILLERLGKPEQAIEEYKAILKLDPNYQRARQQLQKLSEKK